MKPISVKDRDELDKVLNAYDLDDFFDGEEFEIQDESIGPDMIVTSGPAYYVKSLGLLVIEGLYMNKTETGYEADWSLTLIYDWSDPEQEFTKEDAKGYLYYEQDPPMTSLHNFLVAVGKE